MRLVFITYILVLLGLNAMAQTAINEDGSAADATARVDVKSTTKGVLFPSLTTSQRDAIPSPTQGLFIFNSTTGYFNYYSGRKWCEIDRAESLNPAINPAGAENDNGVGVGIDDPDNSAILHLSATDKGILFPRLSSDVAGAPEGMIYYLDNSFIRYYNGTDWVNLIGTSQSDAAGGAGTENGIAFGKSNVDPSAIMEVYATDKGLLLPRMTTAQRDAINSPAEGLLVYNTDDNEFQYYSASIWYAWTSSNPSITCATILAEDASAPDGNYWLDPDGAGGEDPFECECDMTTDGGGWIKMYPLPGTDNVYETEVSTNNGYDKAANDQLQFIDGRTEATKSIDATTYGAHTQDVNYQNPATGSNFTAGQLTAIRNNITTFSSTSRMHTLDCDNDGTEASGGNNDLWVIAEDASEMLLTIYTGTGNSLITYYFWHTSTANTEVDVTPAESTGFTMTGTEFLPAKYILPVQVKFDGDDTNGGGVIWGYEKTYVLIK